MTADGWVDPARWQLPTGGCIELAGGPHDGERVWMPAGPLRPWVSILEPGPGVLIPVRWWHLSPGTLRTGTLYRLTHEHAADGTPRYTLERRAMPRKAHP